MSTIKPTKLMAAASLMLVSYAHSAHAQLDCSVQHIKTLSTAEQLERYTTCIGILKQQHALIKAQKDITALQSAPPGLTNRLPMPEQNGMPHSPHMQNDQPTQKQNKEEPDSVLSVEGAENQLVATLSWMNGRKMTVRKGSQITPYLRVVNVTLDGVELIDEKNQRPLFIGVGQSGIMNPQYSDMQQPYPM